MNVLLTSVGRRAYLVDYFRQVIKPLGGKVFAVNTNENATGFLAADDASVVPSSSESDYVDILVDFCRRHKIRLLFSLHDWDAPVIAEARQQFFDVGTLPVIGSTGLLSICLDKYHTFEKMNKLGVPVPRTVLGFEAAIGLARTVGFPLIVKPRWGQGSLGLFVVNSDDELKYAYRLSEITAKKFVSACSEINGSDIQVVVQQCVVGNEYGCDIVNDLSGNYRRNFVKHKLAMRSGETDIAESVFKPEIDKYAEKIGRWSRHLGCMDSDWIIGQNGIPYLIELNPRFGGGYPFTHCAGVNIPLACVNWARGIDNDDWCRNFKIGVRTFKQISLVSRVQ